MVFVRESGLSVPVELRRRKGTRNFRLTFGLNNQILFSVPLRCADRIAIDFLESQREWIEEGLDKLPATSSLRTWINRYPQLCASGELFYVSIQATKGKSSDYIFSNYGSDVILRVLDPSDDGQLMHVVRCFAKDALYCRVAYQAKRFGLSIPAVSVRNQESRWGSCSCRGAISLNWRLVLLDPELMDYVILHELAHLKQLNHSNKFWKQLEKYDPLYKTHESAINQISSKIMRVAR